MNGGAGRRLYVFAESCKSAPWKRAFAELSFSCSCQTTLSSDRKKQGAFCNENRHSNTEPSPCTMCVCRSEVEESLVWRLGERWAVLDLLIIYCSKLFKVQGLEHYLMLRILGGGGGPYAKKKKPFFLGGGQN